MTGTGDYASLRQAALFSRELLHPVIADAAHGLFRVGKFDLAVFAAFRAVEEEVARKSSCAGQGRDLMAKAFHPTNGPLTDTAAHGSSREATMMLFSRAFGCFRNAVGHRGVAYADALEPASLLTIASQLMRIVDQQP